jgi:hypothetical protein
MSMNPFDEDRSADSSRKAKNGSSSSNPFDDKSSSADSVSDDQIRTSHNPFVECSYNPFEEEVEAAAMPIIPPHKPPKPPRRQSSTNPFDDASARYDESSILSYTDNPFPAERPSIPIASSSKFMSASIMPKPPRLSSRHVQTTASHNEQVSTRAVDPNPQGRLSMQHVAYREVSTSDIILNVDSSDTLRDDEVDNREESKSTANNDRRTTLHSIARIASSSVPNPMMMTQVSPPTNDTPREVKPKDDIKISYCVDHNDENAVIRFLVKEKGEYILTFFDTASVD